MTAPIYLPPVRELRKGEADRFINDPDNKVIMDDTNPSPRLEVTHTMKSLVKPISPDYKFFALLLVGIVLVGAVVVQQLSVAAPTSAANPTKPAEVAAVVFLPTWTQLPTVTPQPTATPWPTIDAVGTANMQLVLTVNQQTLNMKNTELAATAIAINATLTKAVNNDIATDIAATPTAAAVMTESADRKTFLFQAAADERKADEDKRALELANAKRMADFWYGASIAGAVAVTIIALLVVWIFVMQINKTLQERQIDNWIQAPVDTTNVPPTLSPSSGIVEDDYQDDFEGLGVTRKEAFWFFKNSVANLKPQHGESPYVRRIISAMTDWCISKGYATPAAGNVAAQWAAGHSNGSVARAYGFHLNGTPEEK